MPPNAFCALRFFRNVCGKRGMALEAERILEQLLTSGVQADVVSCPQVQFKAEGFLAIGHDVHMVQSEAKHWMNDTISYPL